MANLVVIGSSNTDMVVKTNRFPQPGETIVGGEFFLFPGGKGANQAVAAARLGGEVRFVARVGDDLFGQQAREGFVREGIDVTHVSTDNETASGTALITINSQGENSIVVAPGANANLLPDHLSKVDFNQADIVLAQLETPLPTIMAAAGHAKGRFLLNPAPATTLPAEVYDGLFAITPNETETELLTGILPTDLRTCDLAAKTFHERGVQHVVITLGAKGCYYSGPEGSQQIAAAKVKPVDTTAAGDVFNGALAVALAEGQQWHDALKFAVRAATISVTRMGAQPSVPFRTELV